jgi:hypothetical protein
MSTSETSDIFYETTRRNIPEDSHHFYAFVWFMKLLWILFYQSAQYCLYWAKECTCESRKSSYSARNICEMRSVFKRNHYTNFVWTDCHWYLLPTSVEEEEEDRQNEFQCRVSLLARWSSIALLQQCDIFSKCSFIWKMAGAHRKCRVPTPITGLLLVGCSKEHCVCQEASNTRGVEAWDWICLYGSFSRNMPTSVPLWCESMSTKHWHWWQAFQTFTYSFKINLATMD